MIRMTMHNQYRFLKRKLALMLTLCMLSTLLFSAGAAQAVAIVTPMPVVEPPVVLSPAALLITQDTTPELWLQAPSGHELLVKDANGTELASTIGKGKQKVGVTLPALEAKLHLLRLSATYSDITSEEVRLPVYVDSDDVFNVQDVVRIVRQSEQLAGFEYGPGGVSGFMRDLLNRTNPVAAAEFGWTGFATVDELSVQVDHAKRYIEAVVPFGTNLASLRSEFSVPAGVTASVGGIVQTSGSTANDFHRPVFYEVSDGSRKTVYAVNVIVEPGIHAFGFVNTTPQVMGTINETDRTIDVVVPHGTSLSGLIAGYEVSPGTAVTVEGVAQIPGLTANDYSEPVVYKLMRDGRTVTYMVNVTESESEEPTETPEMYSFGILVGNTTVAGTVYNDNTIEVYVPYGTDPTNLVAVFETSPYATVTVGGVPQVNGVTTNDFGTDVVYTVTLGTESANYTVKVAALSGNAPSCSGPLCDLMQWTLGETGGLWNALQFGSGLVNGAYGTLSTTRPGDTSNGALPDRPAGSTSTHALWYGKTVSGVTYEIGNYLNVWNGSMSMSGGSSAAAHEGSILSPTFIVSAQAGYKPYLTFNSWWEIEGQDPISYDQMEVYAVTAGDERIELGTLNDTIEDEENAASTPQTSGGLGAAPIWVEYRYDLSEFEGETIRIELQFRTRDTNYNAFRGWLVTDVQTKLVADTAMMPPLDEDGGRLPNPELPPIRVE